MHAYIYLCVYVVCVYQYISYINYITCVWLCTLCVCISVCVCVCVCALGGEESWMFASRAVVIIINIDGCVAYWLQ